MSLQQQMSVPCWRPNSTLSGSAQKQWSTMANFWAAALLLLLLVLLLSGQVRRLWRFASWYARMVRFGYRIPGPATVPLLGSIQYAFWNGVDLIYKTESFWKIYGRMYSFWVGPFLHAASSHPMDMEVMLSGYEHLSKGMTYTFLHEWLGQGLLTASGEHWRAHRKIITPTFHFKILEQFVPVFNNNSDIFVRKLGQHASGPAFDVFPLVRLLTLDVICESAMGVEVKAQLNSESEYVTAVHTISKVLIERAMQAWQYPDWVFSLLPRSRSYRRALCVLHASTEEVIRKRKQELDRMQDGGSPLTPDELGRKNRVAFLDLLLLSQRAGAQLSDVDIREEVDTFMFEGHDTTSSGIAFCLFALSRQPEVQERIVEELERVCGGGEALSLDLQTLGQLSYLEMTVKEALRLYPPVPFVLRTLASDQHFSAHKYTVPSTSSMILSFFYTHRCPDVFPDPLTFDPDRFLPDRCAERHPFAYLPFSAGPRNCIGQKFAMLEMKSAVAKTVWNFRILPEPSFEPVLSSELVLKSVNGLLLRLEKRR